MVVLKGRESVCRVISGSRDSSRKRVTLSVLSWMLVSSESKPYSSPALMLATAATSLQNPCPSSGVILSTRLQAPGMPCYDCMLGWRIRQQRAWLVQHKPGRTFHTDRMLSLLQSSEHPYKVCPIASYRHLASLRLRPMLHQLGWFVLGE